MRRRISRLLVVCCAALPTTTRSDDAATKRPAERIALGGFIDGYFAYNANTPSDGANFLPGTGTTAKRAEAFSINLAELDVSLAPNPVGFRLAAGFGNAMDVVHAAEVEAPGTGPDVWRYLIQASILYRTHVGRGLALEGGVFPSHVGFETLASKDNWNYTRSWLAEFSPYYQTGLKASYPFTDRWSAELHVLNGWQIIGENNRAKTLGTQVAYVGDAISASFNTLAGPELPGDDSHWRVFGDFVLVIRPAPTWSFGANVDLARQSYPDAETASWWGAAGYVRFAPSSKTAVALRVEYDDDPDGAISGTPQALREATATFEYRPVERLIVKVEGRYDHSSAAVFGTDRKDAAGQPELTRNETLLILGVVVTF